MKASPDDGALKHCMPLTAQDPARLKKNVIGPLGLAALAIGITSPAMGLFGPWGLMQSAAGPITPLIYLSAMVITLPTAISYAVLNSRFPSAGAASTWLWRSIGPATGFQAGLLMTTYFMMGSISSLLLFAMFFADLLRIIHLPISNIDALYIGILVGIIPVALSCLHGADVSIKTTVRLMVAETLVVLALSATILIVKSSVPGGITLAPFYPSHASNGFSGFWTAVILAVLGFCGYDVVSTAAEEAHAPRKHLPRAILITIVGIAVFWAANAWVFTLSVPDEAIREYARLGVPAVTGIAQSYWGWGSLMVVAAALTGMTAVSISIAQGTSRIIFALARHELLPSVFGQVMGERRVPRNAVIGVLASIVVLDLLTLFLLRNGLDSFTWWAYAVVFFATLTFMAVNVANVAYFYRFARAEFSVLKNLLVPLIGFVVNAYVLYVAFFSALWSSELRIGKNVVVSCVMIFLVEIVAVVCMYRWAPQLFDHGAPISVDEES